MKAARGGDSARVFTWAAPARRTSHEAQWTQAFWNYSGIFGGSTGGALLTELGAFAAGGGSSVFANANPQAADGTQFLYERDMIRGLWRKIFERSAETKGKNPPSFCRDHPKSGARSGAW